jgi:hypothetical protein
MTLQATDDELLRDVADPRAFVQRVVRDLGPSLEGLTAAGVGPALAVVVRHVHVLRRSRPGEADALLREALVPLATRLATYTGGRVDAELEFLHRLVVDQLETRA